MANYDKIAQLCKALTTRKEATEQLGNQVEYHEQMVLRYRREHLEAARAMQAAAKELMEALREDKTLAVENRPAEKAIPGAPPSPIVPTPGVRVVPLNEARRGPPDPCPNLCGQCDACKAHDDYILGRSK